jgi:hypothetical protein
MSAIEVEARALLTPLQRTTILDYMYSLGPVAEVSRVMVDFSGEARTRTVTLRANDKQLELVAKSGDLGSSARHEAVMPLTGNASLEAALSYLHIMGYTNGMVSLRRIFTVQKDGLEYALKDVLNADTMERASCLLEVEALDVGPGGEKAAGERVRHELLDQNLEPLGVKGWEQWVHQVYAAHDKPFVYSPEAAAALTESLMSLGYL